MALDLAPAPLLRRGAGGVGEEVLVLRLEGCQGDVGGGGEQALAGPGHVHGAGEPVGRVPGQAGAEEVHELVGQAAPARAVLVLVEQVLRGAGGEQGVEGGGDRVEVGGGAHGLVVAQLLGGHEAGGAHHGQGVFARSAVEGGAEVAEQGDPAAVEQDVLRLDVPVHDAVDVGRGQCRQDLDHVAEGRLRGHRPHQHQPVREGPAVGQVHHHADPVALLDQVVDLHHVGVREPVHHPGLELHALPQIRALGDHVRVQHLDGAVHRKLVIHSLVDGRVDAPCEDGVRDVPASCQVDRLPLISRRPLGRAEGRSLILPESRIFVRRMRGVSAARHASRPTGCPRTPAGCRRGPWRHRPPWAA